jgi:hypothetical protein
MLTRTTDEEWDFAVGLFRAARSRRGDKGDSALSALPVTQESEGVAYFVLLPPTAESQDLSMNNIDRICKKAGKI